MTDTFVGRRIVQPKKEIIRYLAEKGVRVAPVYDSIDDALKDVENETILLRSEHWQDYEGSSDLFPNNTLNDLLGDGVNQDFTSAILKNRNVAIEKIKLHCQLLGLDYDTFVRDFSHSAWKFIHGTNRTIFADSAVKGKYHIFTLSPSCYSIIDNDVENFTERGRNLTMSEARELIELYEQIRGFLDKDHCYSVEVQSVENRNRTRDHFALQVHRGIDFFSPDFKLGNNPYETGHFRLRRLVRGATKKDGEELLLTLQYTRNFRDKPKMIEEDASMEASSHHLPTVFSEIMFRKRRLQIMLDSQNWRFYEEFSFHCSRSALFKPVNSLVLYAGDFRNIFGENRKSIYEPKLEQVRVHYISDGNAAFIKVLD